MSWWNPLSWGGDVAADIIDRVAEAGHQVKQRVVENPEIVLVPGAALLAAITTYHASKSAGVAAGKVLVKRMTEPEKEE